MSDTRNSGCIQHHLIAVLTNKIQNIKNSDNKASAGDLVEDYYSNRNTHYYSNTHYQTNRN